MRFDLSLVVFALASTSFLLDNVSAASSRGGQRAPSSFRKNTKRQNDALTTVLNDLTAVSTAINQVVQGTSGVVFNAGVGTGVLDVIEGGGSPSDSGVLNGATKSFQGLSTVLGDFSDLVDNLGKKNSQLSKDLSSAGLIAN